MTPEEIQEKLDKLKEQIDKNQTDYSLQFEYINLQQELIKAENKEKLSEIY
mgnify:CR=1 FL=1